MKIISKLILSLVFALYPLIIYFGIKDEDYTLTFSIVVIALILLRMFLFRKSKNLLSSAFTYAGFLSCLIITGGILLESFEVLKAYPLVISFSLASIFLISLMDKNTPIIETLARLKEDDLSPNVISYTRNVTISWILFFILNGSISLYTFIFCDLEVWTLYNGLISYVLMALIFLGELLVRKSFKKREARC